VLLLRKCNSAIELGLGRRNRRRNMRNNMMRRGRRRRRRRKGKREREEEACYDEADPAPARAIVPDTTIASEACAPKFK
jgi:hypothetical protein